MIGTPISIAVDGPGSSGKGTVARLVARQLGYAYVDTGAMYRAVGLACLGAGLQTDDDEGCGALAGRVAISFVASEAGQQVLLDGQDITVAIRSPEASMAASDVAALPSVRAALLDQQRRLGRAGGVVMDGRDIGTVVLPGAELKVFLDAEASARAHRRHVELVGRGESCTYEEVLAELEARDAQDRGRAHAPLAQATDAIYVDTTELSAEQAAARVVALARGRSA